MITRIFTAWRGGSDGQCLANADGGGDAFPGDLTPGKTKYRDADRVKPGILSAIAFELRSPFVIPEAVNLHRYPFLPPKEVQDVRSYGHVRLGVGQPTLPCEGEEEFLRFRESQRRSASIAEHVAQGRGARPTAVSVHKLRKRGQRHQTFSFRPGHRVFQLPRADHPRQVDQRPARRRHRDPVPDRPFVRFEAGDAVHEDPRPLTTIPADDGDVHGPGVGL